MSQVAEGKNSGTSTQAKESTSTYGGPQKLMVIPFTLNKNHIETVIRFILAFGKEEHLDTKFITGFLENTLRNAGMKWFDDFNASFPEFTDNYQNGIRIIAERLFPELYQ